MRKNRYSKGNARKITINDTNGWFISVFKNGYTIAGITADSEKEANEKADKWIKEIGYGCDDS